MISEYCIDVILSVQDYDLEGYILNLNDDKMTIVIFNYEQFIYKGSDDVFIKIPIEEKGVDVYKGTVEEISKNKVYIKNASLLEKEQRRKEVRVSFEEEFRVNQVFISGMLKSLPKCIIFESVNISVSGILLKSELQLPSNIELVLDLGCIQKMYTLMRE